MKKKQIKVKCYCKPKNKYNVGDEVIYVNSFGIEKEGIVTKVYFRDYYDILHECYYEYEIKVKDNLCSTTATVFLINEKQLKRKIKFNSDAVIQKLTTMKSNLNFIKSQLESFKENDLTVLNYGIDIKNDNITRSNKFIGYINFRYKNTENTFYYNLSNKLYLDNLNKYVSDSLNKLNNFNKNNKKTDINVFDEF